MSEWRVTLGDTSGAWVFGTRERAEEWCRQFGNTFIITEVPSSPKGDANV